MSGPGRAWGGGVGRLLVGAVHGAPGHPALQEGPQTAGTRRSPWSPSLAGGAADGWHAQVPMVAQPCGRGCRWLAHARWGTGSRVGAARCPASSGFLTSFSSLLHSCLSSPHPWALPPSPGADEVPARHVRPAGPRDAMCQSSARARPPLIRHLDPRPSLPQGEPAGDAACIRQSLRP